MSFKPDDSLQQRIQTTQPSILQTNQNPQPQEKPKSIFSSIVGGLQGIGQAVGDFGAGAVQGVMDTANSMSELGQKALNATVGKVIGQQQPISRLVPEKLTTPTNTLQSIGKNIEQVGEFFIPVGNKVKALEKGATLLDKVVNLAAKSFTTGAEFSGKTLLQTGNQEQAKTSGLIGLATPPVLKGAKDLASASGVIASNLLAEMIGKSPEHIMTAFKNPFKVAEAMSKKTIPLDVREKSVKALNSYTEGLGQEFKQTLNNLQQSYQQKTATQTLGAQGEQFFNQKAAQNILKEANKVFNDFRISVTQKGQVLDFDKMTSRIVTPTEKNNIQRVWDTIRNQKDFSPTGIQATAERIDALSKFAFGQQTKTSALVAQIHNVYGKVIDSLYPELGALRREYAQGKQIAQGIDDVLKSVKNETANPTAVTGAVKKLSNLFNEDAEAYLNAIKRLEQVSGTDLLNDLVASEFRNIFPGRLGSVMMQAGALTGGIFYNPLILAALPLFSPRFVGKMTTTAGKLFPLAGKTVEQLPKVISPLLNQ